MVKYISQDFKTALNKYKLIDSWFWCRYSINPYNGCEFACTYCDSRSNRYHLQLEFDQIVYVKNNVGTMLDKRLSQARSLLPDVVAIGLLILSGAMLPPRLPRLLSMELTGWQPHPLDFHLHGRSTAFSPLSCATSQAELIGQSVNLSIY